MFSLGDRVRIREDSRYYVENSDGDPKETEGVVYRVYPSFSFYHVRWPGGGWNTYYPEDLELTEQLLLEI